ncbi:MAG TPA: MarR family winged helix-turn-helix transcriptional regulator [Thermoanaerobaculia bacterium]|jgi:DNA-binding MarR family transcriptional regulator|nr:MarR family winged helix-turn-helix transcriptional regulator [Thermoanaerobaculia bacterium]
MSDSARILDAIRRLVRHLRLADRAAQSELGISGAQLFVLAELGKTPALSLNDVAALTRTDQSSVSVVVSRLVEAGLVTRERDTRDARRLVLNLSPSGRAVLDRAPAVPQEQILSATDQLPAAERKHFADMLTALVESLGAEAGPAPMLFEDDRKNKVRNG